MAEGIDHAAEAKVVGPEVVTPFADAVGLINDNEGRLDPFEAVKGLLVGKLLRGKEEELEFPSFKVGERFLTLDVAQGGVDLGGVSHLCVGDLLNGLDLIALQSDQRGNNDGGTGAESGGNLVDRRFAGAGGKDGERVAPIEDGLDGFELSGAKVFKAEGVSGDAPDA